MTDPEVHALLRVVLAALDTKPVPEVAQAITEAMERDSGGRYLHGYIAGRLGLPTVDPSRPVAGNSSGHPASQPEAT